MTNSEDRDETRQSRTGDKEVILDIGEDKRNVYREGVDLYISINSPRVIISGLSGSIPAKSPSPVIIYLHIYSSISSLTSFGNP